MDLRIYLIPPLEHSNLRSLLESLNQIISGIRHLTKLESSHNTSKNKIYNIQIAYPFISTNYQTSIFRLRIRSHKMASILLVQVVVSRSFGAIKFNIRISSFAVVTGMGSCTETIVV